MRRCPVVLWILLWAGLIPCRISGLHRPDVLIFDEDDSIGLGYYDASFGTFSRPSNLRLGGPGDKLMMVTNRAFSGTESGWLQWQSVPGGAWSLVVARPAFRTVDVGGYSNLVLHVNSPTAVSAAHLPSIGLESSPPDVRSRTIRLGEFLVQGVDGDTNTWQRIMIPLNAFSPRTGFSFAKVKDVFFVQNAADSVSHSLWFDKILMTAGESSVTNVLPPSAPSNVITRAGDRSIVLHWERSGSDAVAGYHVYRRTETNGPLLRLTATPVPIPSYADLTVSNGLAYRYVVRSINSAQQESADAESGSASATSFAGDDHFLEYVQQTAFDYFWSEANPANGLVRDRSDPLSDCSIAAVGFALSAIGIGVDRGWISRAQGAARALTTLRTLWEGPQGPSLTSAMGHRGWFYHFLDMNTGLRSGTAELSSIDTALLLGGVLDARQFFAGGNSNEVAIRTLAEDIFNRVDWSWMANGANSLTYGWRPESGFLPNRWIGYNEGMILYLLGLGAATNPLPALHWQTWTSGYLWQTNHGQAFVSFPPLFGHQYSHCWVDFRHTADAYMRSKGLTYFENSRRATLAQRQYAISNAAVFPGYSSNVWGLTSCDGPGFPPYQAYTARGATPSLNDDGTIAPTAVGSSLPFTPEFSVPALRFMYDRFLTNIWTGYGFRDAFNLRANWWGPHVLGIDQGPLLLMAENLRSGRVWQRFMRNPEIQRGMRAAGFLQAGLVPSQLRKTGRNTFTLSWLGRPEGTYQVEYSSDLKRWSTSGVSPRRHDVGNPPQLGFAWEDSGSPSTDRDPAAVPTRYYRVFEVPR